MQHSSGELLKTVPFNPGICNRSSQSWDVIKLNIQPRQKALQVWKGGGGKFSSVTVTWWKTLLLLFHSTVKKCFSQWTQSRLTPTLDHMVMICLLYCSQKLYQLFCFLFLLFPFHLLYFSFICLQSQTTCTLWDRFLAVINPTYFIYVPTTHT